MSVNLPVMIFLLFAPYTKAAIIPSLADCERYIVSEASQSSDLNRLVTLFGPVTQSQPNLLIIAPTQASPKAVEEIEQEIEALKRYLAYGAENEVFVLVSSYGGFPIPAFDGLIYDRESGRLKARFQTKTVKRRQVQAKLHQAFDSIRRWSFRKEYSSDFILSAFALHRPEIKTRIYMSIRSPVPIGRHQITAGRERLRRNADIVERISYLTDQIQTVSLDDL